MQQSTKIQNAIIIMMIVLSGSERFFIDWGFVCILLLTLLSLIVFLKKKTSISGSLSSYVILIYPIIHVIFLSNNFNSNLAYICVLFLLSGFWAIRTYNFYDFRELWLKYLNIICIISLIVQSLHDIGLLIPDSVFKGGTLSTLYFFNCDWGKYRLASIFWEAGQFQIILIFTLCLFTDELYNRKSWKIYFRRHGIVLISLLFTQSTTGYLALMILALGYFLYPKNRKVSFVKRVYMSLIFIGMVFLLSQSNAIQEKLNQSQELEKVSSTTIRLQDNMALLSVVMEAPLVGYGLDTKILNERSQYHDTITSSNGWLYAAASFGMIYIVFLLYVIYKRVRILPSGIPCLFICAALIISQSNEYFIFFPYMLPYLFKFKSYTHIVSH